MNPDSASKSEKFFCGCCAKQEEFNSDDVIFDYFGKEFSEYEYVIENLAIRPAPKKLLDLVPVHSTNISSKISSQLATAYPPCEPLQSTSKVMCHNPSATGEGDSRKSPDNSLKIRDVTSDFISFKAPDENPPVSSFIPRSLPGCSTGDQRAPKDITELRQTIRSKEYRTKKQILSDLYEASEQSLMIRPNASKLSNRPMPSEIKNTIETLKFKKPVPQFFTRTEKRLFHTPGVYFAETKGSNPVSIGTGEGSSEQGGSEATLDILQPTHELRSHNSNYYAVDSGAQTDVSPACPCPKKDKKSLKWKIIINKHSDCKR
ncbi:uncharacterized protein LOC109533139 [Dendroctonus ponderosae]|uniref:Uncharacterized protein n=1 Tax=Dendroctonus ponderosae TaxID=77166 RepID=A0AAR5P1I5_DENPD|nr:uncharacterized protein LOC109533139 [Dendroctonus ponderosae]